MDSKEYLQWQSALGRLTEPQIADLLKRIKALFGKAVEASQEDWRDDWLLHGLILHMKRRALLSDAAIPALLRSRGYRVYKQIAGSLRQDLCKLFPENVSTRAVELETAGLVLQAIIVWLLRADMHPAPSLVLLNAAKTFEALNIAFPGYVKSDLLKIVIKSRIEKGN